MKTEQKDGNGRVGNIKKMKGKIQNKDSFWQSKEFVIMLVMLFIAVSFTSYIQHLAYQKGFSDGYIQGTIDGWQSYEEVFIGDNCDWNHIASESPIYINTENTNYNSFWIYTCKETIPDAVTVQSVVWDKVLTQEELEYWNNNTEGEGEWALWDYVFTEEDLEYWNNNTKGVIKN